MMTKILMIGRVLTIKLHSTKQVIESISIYFPDICELDNKRFDCEIYYESEEGEKVKFKDVNEIN